MPKIRRAIAFFDGQNLFHTAQGAFGYRWPNFDPVKLAEKICADQGWELTQVRFYTGVHDAVKSSFWHKFWSKKLAVLGRRPNTFIFTRPLRYRSKTVKLPGGASHTFPTAEEKGIDVRLAIDLLRLAYDADYDVALVFSQDQDLSEATDEVKRFSREQNRWIKLACAFPSGANTNKRGINGTDWIHIDKNLYDACLDSRDYRP